LCAWIFQILVFGLLPLTAVAILAVYMKKIIEAVGQTRAFKMMKRGRGSGPGQKTG
jgi:sorbitol-specific phosphotransferase system component IIC